MPSRVLFVKDSSWELRLAPFSGYSRMIRYFPGPSDAVDGATWSKSPLRYVLRTVNWNLRVWPQQFRFELSEAKLARKSEGIVHHLYGETTCFLSPFFATGRTIATFHLPPAALESVESRLWKGMARWLAATVSLSERQAVFLRETLGIHVEVIPLGIDVGAVRASLAEWRVTRSQRYCLFVGNYLRDFEALESTVRELESGTTVSVVSSSAEAARLRERLQSNPAKANIIFHSWVSDSDFIDLLGRANVFLLALKDGTANLALLEAMAAGLAIVSLGSYHPNEYLPPNAKCFDREGEQAANEIERLFDTPARLEEMQMAARSMAESLDWPKVVTRLLSLYDSLASP